MQILVRITLMAWRYHTRLILAYLTFLAAIGVSLLIPYLFGYSIDQLVFIDEDGGISGRGVSKSTLALLAGAILGVSLLRGCFDMARTYTVDSLSQPRPGLAVPAGDVARAGVVDGVEGPSDIKRRAVAVVGD